MTTQYLIAPNNTPTDTREYLRHYYTHLTPIEQTRLRADMYANGNRVPADAWRNLPTVGEPWAATRGDETLGAGNYHLVPVTEDDVEVVFAELFATPRGGWAHAYYIIGGRDDPEDGNEEVRTAMLARGGNYARILFGNETEGAELFELDNGTMGFLIRGERVDGYRRYSLVWEDSPRFAELLQTPEVEEALADELDAEPDASLAAELEEAGLPTTITEIINAARARAASHTH